LLPNLISRMPLTIKSNLLSKNNNHVIGYLFFTILSIGLTIGYVSNTKIAGKELYFLLSTSFVLYFLAGLSFIHYQITKENTYYYYICYLLTSIMYFTIVASELHDNHLSSWFNNLNLTKIANALRILTYFFYSYFAIDFLRLKKTDTITYNIINSIGKIYLALCFLSLLVNYSFTDDKVIDAIDNVISLVCMPLGLIGISTIAFRIRNIIAKILIFGSLSFYVGSVLTYMFSSKMIKYPANIFPINYLPFYNDVGTLIESIMFFGSFTIRSKIFLEKEAKEKLKLANTRGDIAKDLHDEIGSTLTSINILSQVSEQIINQQPNKASEMLHQITMQSKAMQQSMSDIVWSLRNENEYIESLVARMREYAAQTLEPLNINVQVNVALVMEEEKLPIEYRKEMLLIFKEATNNIAKHAGATRVAVHLNKSLKNIELTIFDNGKWKGNTTGTGTKSMQERAEALGGTLSIATSKEGTEIKLIVPIP
jgi:signal transduction histidine kinase